MYDVVIVGARVAGSPTAMLLARKGYRVLVVDRATFPSDTLSTHQIQIPGSLALKRWGLFDKVLATGLDGAHCLRFDLGGIVLEGEYPSAGGIDAIYSPRRYLLDKILVEAATEAGAEVREGFITEELLWEDGKVVGVRGRTKDGANVTEKARVVVGADGRHSLVAKQVNAAEYDAVAPLTCGYYTYWANVPLQGGEVYGRGKRFIGLWPTNDKLTLIYIAAPVAEFDMIRADVEGSFLAAIELVPPLAERMRGGQRAERIMGSADLPNFYRKPYGPGWALVGDAGFNKDPVMAMGISDAFRDAELLAGALDVGFAGRQPLDVALAHYERERNAQSKPAYDFTLDTARMNPPAVEQLELFKALAHNQAALSQFLGLMTGVVSHAEFFSSANLFRIIGVRGMVKIVGSKMRRRPQRQAV